MDITITLDAPQAVNAQIAFDAINAARVKNSLVPYADLGAYFTQEVTDIIASYGAQQAILVREKFVAAYEKATDKEKTDAAAILNVDLSATAAEAAAIT